MLCMMCWVSWEQRVCRTCGINLGFPTKVKERSCDKKDMTHHKPADDIEKIRSGDCGRCKAENNRSLNREGREGGLHGAYLSCYPEK